MYQNVEGVRFVGLPGFAILFGNTDGTLGFSLIIWRCIFTFAFAWLDSIDD